MESLYYNSIFFSIFVCVCATLFSLLNGTVPPTHVGKRRRILEIAV